MGDIPAIGFIGPVVALVFAGFWIVFGRKMMSRTDKRYSNYRLGELAQRMGLHVIEGDPSINMIQAHTHHNMRLASQPVGGKVARMLGDAAKETRIHLQGVPYGRPTEFVFYSYTKVADRVAVRFVTSDFQCRLSLQVPVKLPAFEIVNRKAPVGMKPELEWDLPRQSFGNRDLDSRLSLTCADPRMVSYLASVVGGLTGHKYVHIQGYQNVIQSVCTEETVMYAVMDLEQTQQVLEHMAAALAGPVAQR